MTPRRREFLALVAGAGTLSIAGCADESSELNAPPDEDETEDTETQTPTETDSTPNLDVVGGMLPDFGDGTVSVDVTVENRGDEASSATLVVTADAEGADERTREESVSLDPGDEETFTFEFEISQDTYYAEEWGISSALVP
jgi:hypothetical protein